MRCAHDTPCPSSKKHRAGTKRIGAVGLVRLIQLSTVGEVFLEGTCPLSRCPQTAKLPVPMLLGTRRRWVRKATAFRGRSEQDRSALCPACNALSLKTFRWNVFNGIFLAAKTPDTARRVPTRCTEHLASCAQLEQLDEFHGSGSLRFCTMLFVISEYSMSCPYNFICQSPFPPRTSAYFKLISLYWKLEKNSHRKDGYFEYPRSRR